MGNAHVLTPNLTNLENIFKKSQIFEMNQYHMGIVKTIA